VTFADWLRGAVPAVPTTDDLQYHLHTLFPPVRPQGYLEIRYLDAQPGVEWVAPAAVIAALFSDEQIVDRAREIVAPAAELWQDRRRLRAERTGAGGHRAAAAESGPGEPGSAGARTTRADAGGRRDRAAPA